MPVPASLPSCRRWLLALGCGAMALGAELPTADAARREAGADQGLVIVIGSADGGLEAALAEAGDGAVLVQGLARDRAAVAAACERIAASGWYGYATVAWAPGFARLPYNDNLANVVIADLDAPDAPARAEVLRITAPFGRAYVRERGRWTPIAKPLPDAMGEWSHFNHGPDGNPQSPDVLVEAPRGVQWFSSVFSNDTRATPRLAGGRLYVGAFVSNRDEDGKQRRYLGRDAFNGLPLWERDETDEDIRPEMERVMVADDRRIIGQVVERGFARALDGRTGRETLVYDQGLSFAPRPAKGESGKQPQFPPAMLHALAGDRLVQAYRGDVVVLDAESGGRRWSWTAPAGETVAWLAVGDGRVFVALSDEAGARHYSYNNQFWFLARVAALDLASGRQLWTSDAVRDFSCFSFLYADGGLFVQHMGVTKADIATGARSMYTRPYGPLLRFDPATGGIVFRTDVGAVEPKDAFWHNQLRVQDRTVYPGFGWVVHGFDARSGAPGERLTDVFGQLTHPLGFCSQVRGVARGQVGGKFVSFFDNDKRTLEFVAIARNACDLAHYPAYGTIYTSADGCGCSAFLRGLVALQCYQTTGAGPVVDGDRLETGVPVAPTAADAPGGWPMLLGDPTRSSRAAGPVEIGAEPARVVPLALPALAGPIGREWSRSNARLGPITPPVVAGDLMVVAVTDRHEVHGLDATTGAPRWRHRAGGRIDSSPTLWRGLVLFGAHDGTVTALRAEDGVLAWRFLAAPDRRMIVVDGQVESLWPVHGSVLVRDGKAFVVAGRHALADGGIRLWRLDAATGAIEARQVIDARPTSEAEPMPRLYEHQGVLCDALTVNVQGTLIAMGWMIVIDPATLAWVNLRLVNHGAGRRNADPRLQRPEDDYLSGPATIGRDTPGVTDVIYSPAVGLIDRRASQHGSKGQRGFRFGTRHAYESQYRGLRLLRDGTTLYTLEDDALRIHEHTPDWKPVTEIDRRSGKGVGRVLARPLPGRMAVGGLLAGDRILGCDGAKLHVLGRDGAIETSIALPARSVMHGMIAANGRLYVALQNGTVAIYGP